MLIFVYASTVFLIYPCVFFLLTISIFFTGLAAAATPKFLCLEIILSDHIVVYLTLTHDFPFEELV